MNDLGQAAVSADKATRTERGRRTVRKLLEAAAQEFGQRGFHDPAITAIPQRAGVALGTFYTYFESKEELFRALVRDMSQATRVHVAEAVRGAPDRLPARRGGGPPPGAAPRRVGRGRRGAKGRWGGGRRCRRGGARPPGAAAPAAAGR